MPHKLPLIPRELLLKRLKIFLEKIKSNNNLLNFSIYQNLDEYIGGQTLEDNHIKAYFSLASYLASQRKVEEVNLLLEYGANLNLVVAGFAIGGHDELVENYRLFNYDKTTLEEETKDAYKKYQSDKKSEMLHALNYTVNNVEFEPLSILNDFDLDSYASSNWIALGYAIGQHIEKIKEYSDKYRVNPNWIGIGWAIGDHDPTNKTAEKEIDELITKKAVNPNFITAAYAFAGNLDKMKKIIDRYDASPAWGVLGLAISCYLKEAEALCKKHHISIDWILFGLEIGGHLNEIKLYDKKNYRLGKGLGIGGHFHLIIKEQLETTGIPGLIFGAHLNEVKKILKTHRYLITYQDFVENHALGGHQKFLKNLNLNEPLHLIAIEAYASQQHLQEMLTMQNFNSIYINNENFIDAISRGLSRSISNVLSNAALALNFFYQLPAALRLPVAIQCEQLLKSTQKKLDLVKLAYRATLIHRAIDRYALEFTTAYAWSDINVRKEIERLHHLKEDAKKTVEIENTLLSFQKKYPLLTNADLLVLLEQHSLTIRAWDNLYWQTAFNHVKERLVIDLRLFLENDTLEKRLNDLSQQNLNELNKLIYWPCYFKKDISYAKKAEKLLKLEAFITANSFIELEKVINKNISANPLKRQKNEFYAMLSCYQQYIHVLNKKYKTLQPKLNLQLSLFQKPFIQPKKVGNVTTVINPMGPFNQLLK